MAGTSGPDRITVLTGEWTKSSYSFANGDCLEARRLDGGEVQIRHSKHPGDGVLTFSAAEWRAAIAGILNGELR